MARRFVVAVLLGLVLVVGCSKVESGRVVACKVCNKDVVRDVRAQTVPFWDASKYVVTREVGYCDSCGNEPASYTVSLLCERCGETYSTVRATAPRRTEPHDESKRQGFCRPACQLAGTLEHGIDKGSQAVGDVIGRIGKGIADGIGRHVN